MSVLQYIGARYVPKFYENPDDQSTDWKAGVNYEPLTVVTYNGQTYTSKIPVPGTVGNPEDNPDYWALTGEYNAAIGQLRNEVNVIKAGGVDDGSLTYNKLDQQTHDIIEDNYKVVFMPNMERNDVAASNGQSTLFITRYEKKTILYDTNKTHSYAAIKQELINNGVDHIDYFILSHYHFDHYGNIPSLQADGFIDNSTIVYLPRNVSIVPGWDLVQAEVRGYFANNVVHTISSSDPLIVDGMRFDFFNCDKSTFDYYEANNQTGGNTYSVCSYVTCDDVTLLMSGDIVSYAIDYMAALGKWKAVNVMTVPHHGIGTTSMEIFQQTAPMVAVCSVGAAKEYTHDNATSGSDAYLTSVTIARMEALGIPCYHTGYGAVVMGISDGQFTVLSNGKQCRSYNVNGQRLYVYINDQFTGLGCGTQTKPFNSLRQALAFIAELRPVNNVEIQFIGTYIHPDEDIIINVPNYLYILGAIEGGSYNVQLGSVHVYDSDVRFENIRFANTNQHAIWFTRSRGEVRACLIDGDTTALTGGAGAGICSEASNVIIGGNAVTISNRNNAVAVFNGGTIAALGNVSGSGNNTCIYGDNGGDVTFYGDIPSGTTFITGDGFIASSIYTNKGSYLPSAPCNVYRTVDVTSSEVTTVVDLSMDYLARRPVRVYSAGGVIYQFFRSGGAITTPTQVQNAVSGIDPNFNVTVNGLTIEVTHKSGFTVVAY